MSDHVKAAIDVASLGVTAAALASWLPSVAALVSIVWGCIRIFETKTVQRWMKGSDYERRGRK